MRDTFHSSLEISEQFFIELGLSETENKRTVETFRDHDVVCLYKQWHMAGDMKQWTRELEEMFRQDEQAANEKGPS